MNWRLVLIIIFILEGIYYLTNRLLFHRTFREINYWEWIIVIMIIPLKKLMYHKNCDNR